MFIAEVEKTCRVRSRGLKAVDGVPSGCGKRTLLMMTSGLYRFPPGGSSSKGSRSIALIPRYSRRRSIGLRPS